MRTFIRTMLTRALAAQARAIIRHHKPKIVMVTGSVGKTSTKDAVAAALSTAYNVRKSEKSFNSEIGVPLTIIGAKNPWANPFAWLGVFWKGWRARGERHYPELLVLEVGADKPGDLSGILQIAQPDAVVVTMLPAVPVHVQFYDSPEAVREEEFLPARALPPGAPLVINADDPFAIELARSLQQINLTTFGYAEHATVRIEGLTIAIDESAEPAAHGHALPIGTRGVLTARGDQHAFTVLGAFGRTQMYAPAAALTLALSLGVPFEKALEGLAAYVPPPGRGKLFHGIKNTIIIDDSYNASPIAVEESLKSLALLTRRLPHHRKIAVLGDMRELGSFAQSEHERIGKLAAAQVDVLAAVGEQAGAYVAGAKGAGMQDAAIYQFATSAEAAEQLPKLVQEGDIVLIKGSQGVRLERISRVLLADDADAEDLVRQDTAWKHR